MKILIDYDFISTLLTPKFGCYLYVAKVSFFTVNHDGESKRELNPLNIGEAYGVTSDEAIRKMSEKFILWCNEQSITV